MREECAIPPAAPEVGNRNEQRDYEGCTCDLRNSGLLEGCPGTERIAEISERELNRQERMLDCYDRARVRRWPGESVEVQTDAGDSDEGPNQPPDLLTARGRLPIPQQKERYCKKPGSETTRDGESADQTKG